MTSPDVVDFERAHERQELAAQQSRERVARLHLWLQGGPIPPTTEERQWVKEWFSDLHGLVKLRDETGGIPPSSEYHMERARRFIAGDLDALLDDDRGSVTLVDGLLAPEAG